MSVRPPQLFVADAHRGPAARGDGFAPGPFGRLSAACAPGAFPPASTGSLEEVRRDAAQLRRAAAEGAFTPLPEPTGVVYRISSGDHQQTGVVVEVPVEDYRNGLVRRHEATHPDREQQLADFLAAARLELVPVTLTHATRPGLQATLEKVAAGAPDLQLTSDDGVVQTVWVAPTRELARAIEDELVEIDVLYIADGHHRMAAARRHADRSGTGDASRPCDFVLGTVFPAAEMRVLGYHRCVTRPAGAATSDLLAQLAGQPVTERIEECTAAEAASTEPGVVALYADGRWHRIWLRRPRGGADAREELDVAMVDDHLIAPMLAVPDVSSDRRVTRFPGTADAAELAAWCDERDAVGFLLHPPSIQQIMAVSDAGQMMPPKSTWFEPKARAGPFLRDLSEPGQGS